MNENNYNMDKYATVGLGKFVAPSVLISLLEDLMNMSIDELKKIVNEAEVNVTEDEIKKYLSDVFSKENPELKSRIEKRSKQEKRPVNLIKLTAEDIKNSAENFIDELNSYKYTFKPYTLEYFKKYISIVKRKSQLLLHLIEKIGKKQFFEVQEEIQILDIQLDEKGNIFCGDIIRLIKPTKYNIDDLKEKVSIANDLQTYSSDRLYKYNTSSFPELALQSNNLYNDGIKGNVPLSKNQRDEISEEEDRRIANTAKIIVNMFD